MGVVYCFKTVSVFFLYPILRYINYLQDSYHDNVSTELRTTLDSLLFDLWINPLSDSSVAGLKAIYFGNKGVPADYVHSHSGLTFCEVSASKGLTDVVAELLTASLHNESSCAANAWYDILTRPPSLLM